MKFATALAGAAVVVAGGTAFTAGNDMIEARTYGYGETSVTGVNVTSEVITRNADDNSKIDEIVFTSQETPNVDMSGAGFTASLQVNAGGTEYNYACTKGYLTGVNTFTCATTEAAGHQLLAAELVKIGFTVKSNAEDDPA